VLPKSRGVLVRSKPGVTATSVTIDPISGSLASDEGSASFTGMARVILVRHCESEANLAGPEGGGSNSPLSARGRAQIKAVHNMFLGFGLADLRLVSSPLIRAADTAQAISRALGVDIEFDARLSAGEAVAARSLDPSNPNTLQIIGAEVLDALKQRIHNESDTLVVVSHRYPIWALLTQLLGDRGTEIMDELNNLGNGDSLELKLGNGVVTEEPVHRPLASC
jgi:broad specificity phosphatase PhoE